jgi:hypothetical protein
MGHRRRQIDLLVVGACARVDGHPAPALRIILRQFDEAADFGTAPDVRHDQALASRVQQPGDVLVLQVRNAHDGRNPGGVRVRDQVDHGLQVEGGVLGANPGEIHPDRGQSMHHAASAGVPYDRAKRDTARFESRLEPVGSHRLPR